MSVLGGYNYTVSFKNSEGEFMYKILRKNILNPTVVLMDIDAPFVARKAQPGQL